MIKQKKAPNNIKDIKNKALKKQRIKINKKAIIYESLLFASEVLLALCIMLTYNYLLTEIYELKHINIIQAYTLFFTLKLMLIKNKAKINNYEERIYDYFKNNMMKFFYYLLVGGLLKVLLLLA